MICFSPELSAAVLPNARLTSIFPAGCQQGTEVKVTVTGIDLTDPVGLMFSHPGITAVPQTLPQRSFETEAEVVPNQFLVRVASDVPVGGYEVRVLGRNGLSSSRLFQVSDLPEFECDARNTTLATAMNVKPNSIVNCSGTSGDAAFYYALEGRAGQRVLIHCESTSIDSQMVAMLELLGPDGNPQAFGRTTMLREPLIDFTPPTDGRYVLKVFEATYRAGKTCFYRLEFSDRPYVDFIWPPSGVPGSTGTYTLFGHNLPGGIPAQTLDPKFGLEELSVQITLPQQGKSICVTNASTTRSLAEIESIGFEYRLLSDRLPSRPAWISAAMAPVVMAQQTLQQSGKAQPVTLPCEIVGQFYPSATGDQFAFQGVRGETYCLQVYSETLHLPTDPVLVVSRVERDAAGQETLKIVKEADDPETLFHTPPFNQNSHDPDLQFTADADAEYRVQVRDLYAGANSHPRNRYRLAIRKSAEDFRLLVATKELGEPTSQQDPQRAITPLLRRGGCQLLAVQAYRQGGFSGPITLSVEGLPAGVTCSSLVMTPGQSQATLILVAAEDTPAWQGTIRVKGVARIEDRNVEHYAAGAAVIWDKNNSAELASARVTSDLALAVIPETIPLSVLPSEEKIWETCPADKLSLTARFDRHLPTSGNLKLQVCGLPTTLYPLNRIPAAILDPQVAQGTVVLAVNPKMPPGDYPCYLQVQTRTSYARNPEAVQVAQRKQAELESHISQLKQTIQEKQAAQDAATQTLTELTSATADSSQSTAIEAAKVAQTQAAANLKKTMEQLQTAQALLPNFTKRVADLEKAAKPVEIELFVVSPPLIVRVHDLPAKLTLPARVTVKAGSEIEIPIALERLFEFREAVKFEIKSPAGVNGLTATPISISPTEQAGKVMVKTTNETPAGEYSFTLVPKLTYQGQGLQGEYPVTVEVQ